MTRDFQKTWLGVTAFVIASFAPIMFLGSIAGFSWPVQVTLDLLALPLDGAPVYGDAASRFIAAILGGILLGWGALIWGLRQTVFDAAPEGVRKAVVMSLLCWFVLDSAGSVVSGHASNVLFNIVILALAVGPLARPAAHPKPA